jgi:drug/metabolite transporter (DMT)-like permease
MLSRGVYYMMLATFVFAVMNVAVKWLGHIPAIEIIFFRSLVSLVMSGVALKSKGIYLFGNNKKVLLIRGVAGSLGLILFFTAIQQIPLASAVTLMFLSPIFTAILGIWIVKESVKWLQWVFFAVSFGGIMVIQGFDARVSGLMALVGIGGAFFSGIAYNMIRKLKKTEHPLVIIFYFPLVTLPLTLVYLSFDWVTPVGWDWAVLLLVGVLTQIAQYFMTRAYQEEELSKVANIQFIGIIYALGFGWVLFGETFDFMTYLGMSMVLVGVILNVAYKQRLQNRSK